MDRGQLVLNCLIQQQTHLLYESFNLPAAAHYIITVLFRTGDQGDNKISNKINRDQLQP